MNLQGYPIPEIPKTQTNHLVTETRYTTTCLVTVDWGKYWEPAPDWNR